MRFLALISLFFYANLSLALGLGDAELKSNLNERLQAKVDVTDADSTPDASCFSATDIGDPSAFKKASINIKANANGSYQLSISTHDVISELIVNLRVAYHCEPNVSRDYVLLLDPAPATIADNANSNDANTNLEAGTDNTKQATQKTQKVKNKKSTTVETATPADGALLEQPAYKKASKKKKPKTVSTADEKLLEAYTGKQNNTVAPQPAASPEVTTNANAVAPHKSADKPFLVISAGNAAASNGTNEPSLSLRLATEIDVNRPDEAIAAQPSATDTMDEATVMSNRLAHLEKQIASLQTRNAQLVTEAKIAKEEGKSFNWMQFSKIALAILLTLAAIEIIRRRFFKTQEKQVWFEDEDEDFNNSRDSDLNLEDEFSSNGAQPSFDESAFSEKPAKNQDVARAIAEAATEKVESSSILEDADVFIEHGRPTLAIQLLQNHLSESPAESPVIWLKLLNLLSKEGNEADFDAAVLECNKYFNIKAAKFGSDPITTTSTLEDYPHIVTRLEGVWGSPYAVGFLNDLIYNKRSQPREGLDQGAFDDLFFLKNIAKNLESIDPTLFKVTPMPSSNTPARATEPSIAKTNIENANFNDALFTDAEPLTPPKATAQKSNLKDTKLGTKSNFNQFEDVASYEVNMIHGDELHAELSTKPTPDLEVSAEPPNNTEELSTPEVSAKNEPLEFDMPEKLNTFDASDDELFKAEEINFSLPTEKVEYATDTKAEVLTEEIVFDSPEPASNQSLDLEFSLDFPNEETSSPAVKDTEAKPSGAKGKAKNKPAFKNLTESNEIEWNLPEIDLDPKSDQ